MDSLIRFMFDKYQVRGQIVRLEQRLDRGRAAPSAA